MYNNNQKMDPWFITGVVDGEGCFSISVIKDKKHKTGWQAKVEFTIGLHQKDIVLLEDIQKFLGGIGGITKHDYTKSIKLRIASVKDLIVLIDHFDKYSLISSAAEKNLLISCFLNKHLI